MNLSQILNKITNRPPNMTINNFIAELDERLAKNQTVLDDLNSNIDRLTNHVDGFDYAISACSGVLCGFIDSFFIGPKIRNYPQKWNQRLIE